MRVSKAALGLGLVLAEEEWLPPPPPPPPGVGEGS